MLKSNNKAKLINCYKKYYELLIKAVMLKIITKLYEFLKFKYKRI